MAKGQRNYSTVRVSQHALERFVERFLSPDSPEPTTAEYRLRRVLEHAKRLGRNERNGAIAALGVDGDRMLVAILQDGVCTTVLTWPQFKEQLSEFGRPRLPRKPKRMMRRLVAARNKGPKASEKTDASPRSGVN
jgi:hypothetical protein